MSLITKPMLASKAPDDLSKVQYPVLASVKLDGIRCLIVDDEAVSRKFKPIPNDYVREWCEANLPSGFDGELLLRDMTRPFKEVSSAIMKKSGEPDFVYAAFDYVQDSLAEKFESRYLSLAGWENAVLGWKDMHCMLHHFHLVEQILIEDEETLKDFMAVAIEAGYEGAMIRTVDSPYKCGRSTVNQGYLLKLKLFADEEAHVIGVEEQMHNGNALETDELGHAKRSTRKAGKTGKRTMGSLVCEFADGTRFNVGTGFDDAMRHEIWSSVDVVDGSGTFLVIGRTVKIKHQPDPGGRQPGQAPRFPVFLGFRNTEID